MNSIEDRQFFADAWFKALKKKIDRTSMLFQNGNKLDSSSWEDEAFILCVVYLDRLSNRIKSSYETCHRRFCTLLINHGGNDFFGKISFRQLLRNLKKKKKVIRTGDKILNHLNSQGCDLDKEMFCKNNLPESYQKIFEREELLSFFTSDAILTQEELKQLEPELWQGSIASICYEFVRCPTIHEDTQRTLRVGETQLNFNILYPALNSVYDYIESTYRRNGKFLGFDKNEHLFSYHE